MNSYLKICFYYAMLINTKTSYICIVNHCTWKKITLSLQFLCEIVYEYFDKSSFQQERLETQLWSQEGQFTTIALGASQLKHWPSDHFWVKFLTIKSFISVLWRNESVIVLHYNVKVFICWDIFPCLTWCRHCMSVLS